MAKKHDVVIIGGGHNGLIVAGYLAKSGLDVCVVESNDKVGGGVMTREVPLPGFKHDLASMIHGTLMQSPLIKNDELGLLSKYGLKYIQASGPLITMVFPDDRALVVSADINKTIESISQFSRRDAEIYPKYCESLGHIADAINIMYFSPPPSFGSVIAFLDSSEEGREYLRMMFSSPLEIAEEWFESEQVKMMICGLAHGSLHSPLDKGTGHYAAGLAHIQSARPEKLGAGEVGFNIPRGGSWALCGALEACIKDHGGTILTSTRVRKVKVVNGVAKAVVLDSGEEIEAKKAVVSGVNVKQLFLEMLTPEELPAGFQNKVRRLKHSQIRGQILLTLAVNNAPQYKAGGDVNKAYYLYIYPLLQEYLEVQENYKRGIPNTKCMHVFCATLVDPSRAPAGKHTLRILNLEPYELKDGSPAGWDKIKEGVAGDLLKAFQSHTTNMLDENILGKAVYSPLDYVRDNPSFVQGDSFHLSMNIQQLFGNRPLPGWSNYKTPVKNLYMCGASTHPGGTITGGGRIAVQVMMEDMGIDFKKVISK